MEEMMQIRNEAMGIGGDDKFPDVQVIYPYESIQETAIHTNKINNEYMDYIKKMDETLLTGVSYTSMMPLNLFRKDNDVIKPINSRLAAFQSIPKQVDKTKASYLETNYDLLYGEYPKNKEDIVIVVNTANKVHSIIVEALGLDKNAKSINFEKVIGSEIKLITNDNYYIPIDDYFTINSDLNKAYDSNENITLKVSGIIRLKEDLKFAVLSEGIGYQEELIESIIEDSMKSKVVLKQTDADYNVLTGEKFDLTTKEGIEEKNMILSTLGGNNIPFMINLYPDDFNDKEQIIEYLDKYNKDLKDEDKILYNDLSSTFSSLSGNIMNAITIVLVAFSSIALIVSSIMIGIITYISVLERTKEIGILRSLGARKKDIARVFNAETFIVGLTSGILGIIIARLLVFPANSLIEGLTDLPNVAVLNPIHAGILILISLTLTIIGGYIPAIMASKKDPVEALRTE
ncbi:MAG: ABC transporter permease, partial [Bacilli bacterium]|nr:ABC transporter permease [Bacilli bacterium]